MPINDLLHELQHASGTRPLTRDDLGFTGIAYAGAATPETVSQRWSQKNHL